MSYSQNSEQNTDKYLRWILNIHIWMFYLIILLDRKNGAKRKKKITELLLPRHPAIMLLGIS